MVPLSHSYVTIGKTIALTIWTFVGKVKSLIWQSDVILFRLSQRQIKPNSQLLPFYPLSSWFPSSGNSTIIHPVSQASCLKCIQDCLSFSSNMTPKYWWSPLPIISSFLPPQLSQSFHNPRTPNSMKESESEVAKSCPTLCDPMDCSLPGSTVHGIFQARVLEWGAISFSRRSSQTRDWSWVSHIVGRHFTIWATREIPISKYFISL